MVFTLALAWRQLESGWHYKLYNCNNEDINIYKYEIAPENLRGKTRNKRVNKQKGQHIEGKQTEKQLPFI